MLRNHEYKAVFDLYQNRFEDLCKRASVFKSFCEDEIKNVKMRKLTLDALKYRDDYQAVLEWQKNLDKNIESALKYLRASLKHRDEEINKYIDRVYIYLDDVVKQVSQIANKTAVESAGNRKYIFSIKAPHYEAHQAKMDIRGHLMYMSEQINIDNEKIDSQEKVYVVKKKIADFLSTKTLLNVIFKGKEIKVSCRKVTNDFKISSGLTDWTNSNKWSGGEVWSKNMTLFLGIQNYIAERKHMPSKRMKRQRTVLLDNPFGKASSDHVLEPVFKIADQLGFQLIAFTAHAEGKFIGDYFPIVYSCKLRNTAHKDFQVMTNDKEINYAYLNENNPKSVLRLQNAEQEQLRLFE